MELVVRDHYTRSEVIGMLCDFGVDVTTEAIVTNVINGTSSLEESAYLNISQYLASMLVALTGNTDAVHFIIGIREYRENRLERLRELLLDGRLSMETITLIQEQVSAALRENT